MTAGTGFLTQMLPRCAVGLFQEFPPALRDRVQNTADDVRLPLMSIRSASGAALLSVEGDAVAALCKVSLPVAGLFAMSMRGR